MRGKKRWVVVSIFMVVLLGAPSVMASVIINEIFADPPSGLNGDANNDGIRSVSDDEFIEFLNNNASASDVSGWSISDNIASRHVFPSGSLIAPYSFLVLFGGGAPSLPGVHWQTASSGSLSLNNGGDTITLFDSNAVVVHQVLYGSIGGRDQSITLFPDGQGTEFVLHADLADAQGHLFSPGTGVDSRTSLIPLEVEEPVTGVEDPAGNPEEPTGNVEEPIGHVEEPVGNTEDPIGNATVPELPALVYFALGLGLLLLRKSPAAITLGGCVPLKT